MHLDSTTVTPKMNAGAIYQELIARGSNATVFQGQIPRKQQR